MLYFVFRTQHHEKMARYHILWVMTRAVERGGYPGLLPRGPGQKGARTQTVTNLQVLQDMK